MKKILLQINNFSVQEEQYGKLKSASFFVRGAQATALLGLDLSGPELIFRLFLGELMVDWKKAQIYYDGRKVDDYGQIQNLIYYFKEENRPLPDWSAAEYIFSDRSFPFLFKSTKRKMAHALTSVFEKYGVEFSPVKKIGSLTELERREMELIRAIIRDAKILLLEDECGGMSADETGQYAKFLHRILDESRCAFLLSHTESVFRVLADDIIIFRKGRIVKKAFDVKGEIPFDWKAYVLGNTMIERKSMIDRLERNRGDENEVVYRVSNIRFAGNAVNLSFHKGEITTFVILDNRKRKEFFQILSGRKTAEGVLCAAGDKESALSGYAEFVSHRIISAARLKSGREIIPQMSIEDNLFLPSQGKLGAFLYPMENANVKKSLYQDFAERFLEDEKMVRELSPNEVTAMTLERWYIFRPKALILFDAFVGNDPYGISVIQSYIKKFSNLGAAVILIDSSLEYAQELSDRIFESTQ